MRALLSMDGHAARRLVALSLCLGACQPIPDGPCELGDPWREDLNVLVSWIDTIHPEPTRVRTEDELSTVAREACGSLAGVDGLRAELVLAEVAASYSDAHTGLRFGHTTPLDRRAVVFHPFEDGYRVIAVAEGYERWLGARLRGVGALEVDAFQDEVLRVRHSEPELAPYAVARTLRSASLTAALLGTEAPALARFDVELEGAAEVLEIDEQELIEDEAVASLLSPAHWPAAEGWRTAAELDTPMFREPERLYRSELLAEGRVLYVRHREVVNAPGAPGFNDWFRAELAAHPADSIDALVLDWRQNPGGNFYTAEASIAELVGSAYDRPGKLYVLVDGRTFSAAIYLAHLLRFDSNATFVGAPVGDRLVSYLDTNPYTLPHSRAPLFISSGRLLYPDRRGQALAIDVPVALRYEDYAAGRDAALETTLARIAE